MRGGLGGPERPPAGLLVGQGRQPGVVEGNDPLAFVISQSDSWGQAAWRWRWLRQPRRRKCRRTNTPKATVKATSKAAPLSGGIVVTLLPRGPPAFALRVRQTRLQPRS